jgi:hypothetical protein
MKDTQNACHFQWMCTHLIAVEPINKFLIAQGLLLKGSFNHSINFSSHILEFYVKSATQTWHCTLRHHEYNATQTLLCACDKCIRLNSCSGAWLLKDIQEYVQTCSEKIHCNATQGKREMNSVWILYDQDS